MGPDPVDQCPDGLVLCGPGGGVDDETGGGGKDLLLDLQAIFPEGPSRGHQIHDPVGEPRPGGQLKGAIKFEDGDGDAPGKKVRFGDTRVLCGDPEGPPLFAHRPVALGAGDDETAIPDIQVQGGDDLPVLLFDLVLSHDPRIGAPELHIGDDIGGADEEDGERAAVRPGGQGPGVFLVIRESVASFFKKGQDVLEHLPFGKSQNQWLRAYGSSS